MGPRLFILIILMTLPSVGCKAPAYLPEPENVGNNEFGSHITIHLLEGSEVEGELISIDEGSLIILTQKKGMNQLRNVSIEQIRNFRLMYAEPASYGATIPVSALISLSHGYFALITAPVNLAVTGITTTRATRAFTYDQEDISWDELKMFARFPQGLPSNIKVTDLEGEVRME